ncbi:MAG TPA: M23 family metallopeptidase [Rhizomicrobium sp.]|jgi:murein DD-endopeptidase MepM/ murein hydrolase activator NlpD|nr:M23 family metallopeptidase [Rhizomicrobium sp.]
MASTRLARKPAMRAVRAPAIAIRAPVRIPRREPRTLHETLVDAGIMPRSTARGTHGLVWRWFAYESTAQAVGNTVTSVLLLLPALTMTAVGMQIAVALNAAAMIYVVLNNGFPYVGLVMFAFAGLKAAHAYFDRRAHTSSRVLGFVLAAMMFAAGIWLEVMFGYADFVPWMLKPAVAFAGGEATARIAAFNAALVSYFEPGVAGAVALLLGAKQVKSAIEAEPKKTLRRAAVSGLVASLCVLAIGAQAGYRHYTGADARDGMSFAIGGETLAPADRTYGPLFAPGVPCHVSSLYGWRDDPLAPGHAQHHQGVDVAVAQGTPVHAMADGRILFADTDAGLGNFTALQVGGRDGAPTIVNGHMEQLLVHPGDVVHRGDVLGLAGSTGRSTGPHVHLQLCAGAHTHAGGFVCGGTSNPYENWPTLAALAHMSCVDGPSVF